MSKYFSFLLVFVFVMNSCLAQNKEDELVRKSFENYKSAILNDKGEEAVKYVDSRTLKYYSEMLEKTKSADSLELNNLALMDKLMVLSIRHQTSKKEILSFDGKELLVYAIKEGMVGKNSVANNSIGDIKIDGTFAKGQLIVNGRKVPIYMHFYKEDDTWKIDLTSIFPPVANAFKKVQEQSGFDANEYILSLLEMVTGRKPGSEIWKKIE
ncbi:MAG: hypothetical protein AB8B65_15600 [Kordia sp.]|uniref:hypothetical protein n=1 Tax=Kordia sp. TaxID=1965332 RepID=UPI00385CD0F1